MVASTPELSSAARSRSLTSSPSRSSSSARRAPPSGSSSVVRSSASSAASVSALTTNPALASAPGGNAGSRSCVAVSREASSWASARSWCTNVGLWPGPTTERDRRWQPRWRRRDMPAVHPTRCRSPSRVRSRLACAASRRSNKRARPCLDSFRIVGPPALSPLPGRSNRSVGCPAAASVLAHWRRAR